MEKTKEYISIASDKADRAAWALRDCDLKGPHANSILFEAWDELQTAAKLVQAAMQEFKRGA